jgi:CheY-like chemotaxis protein
MSKKAILLVDDDTLFLMLTRKMLEGQTYLERIDAVTTVAETQAYFQGLKEKNIAFPDAVFIDLDMPLVSGLELAQQLRGTFLANHPEIKIYILSSSISQRDRHTAESLAAVTDYMEKPLSPQVLKQALGLEATTTGDRQRISASTDWQQGEKSKQ